jgi:hypothetical protein
MEVRDSDFKPNPQDTKTKRTKDDESSTGCVWADGFHHVMVRSRLTRVYETYEPMVS